MIKFYCNDLKNLSKIVEIADPNFNFQFFVDEIRDKITRVKDDKIPYEIIAKLEYFFEIVKHLAIYNIFDNNK